MGKVKYFTINFSNQAGIYNPGQQVQGEVNLQVQEEVKIRAIRLEFCGYADVHWSESHGSGKHRHTVHYRSHEGYFQQNITVLSAPGGDSMMLQPGAYRYPFNFQIPLGSPSSFEGHSGRVRYHVAAEMDRPWAFDETDKRYFTVISLLDLNQIPEAKNPMNAEDSKTLCCLCCASGPIVGKHSVPKLGYVPGEALPIKAECINHSSRNGEIFMELIQSVRYITARKTRTINTIVAKTTKRTIGKGDSDYWSGEEIIIPPLPSTGLPGCNIIDITYFWQFVMDPSGPAINLRVPIPLIIGGIPLVSSAQQYGAPSSGGGIMLPGMTLPANVPQPSFASYSTAMYPPAAPAGPAQAPNVVQPGDPGNYSSDSFAPQYPYYNWNKFDSSFQPTTTN